MKTFLIAFFFLLAAQNGFAQVSGVVKDQSTLLPISGVLVSLQATANRTTTDTGGHFVLFGLSGSDLTIAAAKKGYYSQSVIVSTPASDVQILIETVPQESDTSYAYLEPTTCGGCHPDQYNQWSASAMSHAGVNSWVYDIYDGTGTAGGMNGFVYTRDSRFAGSNPNSECASCHQPQTWIDSPFSALEDINNPTGNALNGVSCDVCHKIAHVDETKTNFPGIYPGAVTFTRPGSSSGQVEYGVLGDATFSVPTLMRPSYQPQLTAAVCATCHQDKNDPDEDGNFEEENGVISEPTYLEWLASPYADTGSVHYATCVTCHMPSYGATQVSSVLPLERDSLTIRGHQFKGTSAEYLENAVSMNLYGQISDSLLSATVIITNNQTGHHVPTGVTFRNMILLIEAWTEGDSLQPFYLGSQVIHELGGVGSPSLGYYAGLPGKIYTKMNHDSSGQGPVFYTDATGITFDNRIPALESDTTLYSFRLPNPNGVVQVRAQLIYRRAFRFVVDAKQWTLDGYGEPLEDVLPPHYGHLMEEAAWSSSVQGISSSTHRADPFRLGRNFPNPFNLTTTITYTLPISGRVSLSIYDILGREVRRLVNGYEQNGEHTIGWDGKNSDGHTVSSGLYFYRLQAGSVSRTRKMILVK